MWFMQNSLTQSDMVDIQKAIHALEREYAEQKDVFENWKVENASEAGTAPYAEYVAQFREWEKGVVDQLKELRASVARQPVAPEPELPMVDLDTQLNTLLGQVDAPQFIMAFMTMAQKDPSFLKKAFEVVMEECRSTGFSNPILPQQGAPMHPSQVPSFGGHYPPTHHRPQQAHRVAQSASTPVASTGLYLPPRQSHSSFVQGSTPLLTNPSSSFSQLTTPYSAGVPEGWAVEPAIRKQPRQSSPIREYRTPRNLPFKDFSQS